MSLFLSSIRIGMLTNLSLLILSTIGVIPKILTPLIWLWLTYLCSKNILKYHPRLDSTRILRLNPFFSAPAHLLACKYRWLFMCWMLCQFCMLQRISNATWPVTATLTFCIFLDFPASWRFEIFSWMLFAILRSSDICWVTWLPWPKKSFHKKNHRNIGTGFSENSLIFHLFSPFPITNNLFHRSDIKS